MSPLIWSIAGTDSGGGAGLSADQRAAEAFGLHLCPVPAAITAQNSVTVAQVQAISPDLLRAQLATLHADLPPLAVKTGLLGSAENARELARAIDRLRRERHVPLVVDPVLRASTGAALANGALLGAYRHEVLPRASVITPNRREAVALLGAAPDTPVPELAQGLRGMGAQVEPVGALAVLQLQRRRRRAFDLERIARPAAAAVDGDRGCGVAVAQLI